jgi:hypothetical protein
MAHVVEQDVGRLQVTVDKVAAVRARGLIKLERRNETDATELSWSTEVGWADRVRLGRSN